MWQLGQRLWRDDAGIIISAELVLILTIVVLGVIVGLVQMRNAVVAEFHDLSLAWSHLNQSYAYTGFWGCWKWWGGRTAWTAGSSFIDYYDGTNILTTCDFGVGGREYYVQNYVERTEEPGCCTTCRGTILLKDGALIPLHAAGTGTWSLPGGTILAEFSSARGMLLLADGTSIPFLHGCPGTLTMVDGVVLAARAGAAGALVLQDGRIATLDSQPTTTAKLPDGATAVYQLCPIDHVVLADGKVMKVTAGVNNTLVLPDGKTLDLHDAVAVAVANAPSAPVPHANPVVPHGPQFIPAPLWQPHDHGFSTGPVAPDQGLELMPQDVVPDLGPAPHGLSAPPARPFRLAPPRFKRQPPVIPQGPAPQYLPQV